jgi:exonuclease III
MATTKLFCDSFTIFQWNCRSLHSNILQFEHHINKNDYSALVLQSLNVTPNNLPKLRSYFYPPIYRYNFASKKVQVAIYIRENLEYMKIEDVPKIENVYICGAILKINPHLSLNLLSVYYPEGPKDDNSDWLKQLETVNTKWLIMGDFNAHSTLWDNECSSNVNNRFVDNVSDSNFYLLNDGSITRVPDISVHRPSAIDLSLISIDLTIKYRWETFSETLEVTICQL